MHIAKSNLSVEVLEQKPMEIQTWQRRTEIQKIEIGNYIQRQPRAFDFNASY